MFLREDAFSNYVRNFVSSVCRRNYSSTDGDTQPDGQIVSGAHGEIGRSSDWSEDTVVLVFSGICTAEAQWNASGAARKSSTISGN